VDKQEFLARLWPDTVVEEAALAENISRLRRALGEGEGQRLIATVPKRGYRFEAAVRTLDGDAAPLQPAAAADPEPAPTAAAPGPPRARAWPRWTLPLVGALALAAAAGVAWKRSGRASSAPPIHSLAVLPLENLSHDPEQEYFADGMTDELVTHLARIRALRVISRTSASRLCSCGVRRTEMWRAMSRASSPCRSTASPSGRS